MPIVCRGWAVAGSRPLPGEKRARGGRPRQLIKLRVHERSLCESLAQSCIEIGGRIVGNYARSAVLEVQRCISGKVPDGSESTKLHQLPVCADGEHDPRPAGVKTHGRRAGRGGRRAGERRGAVCGEQEELTDAAGLARSYGFMCERRWEERETSRIGWQRQISYE